MPVDIFIQLLLYNHMQKSIYIFRKGIWLIVETSLRQVSYSDKNEDEVGDCDKVDKTDFQISKKIRMTMGIVMGKIWDDKKGFLF